MLIGYCRVSAAEGEESLALQERKLCEFGVSQENIITEVIKRPNSKRVQMEQCVSNSKAGDAIVITHLDRMFRSTTHLLTGLKKLTSKGVDLVVIGGVDTRTLEGKLWLQCVSDIASVDNRRQREEMANARTIGNARGRMGGRRFALSKDQVVSLQSKVLEGEYSVSDLCRIFKIRRNTLYRYINPSTGELGETGKRVLTS